MKRALAYTIFPVLILFSAVPSAASPGRYLVLNFDCRGKAAGQSEAIGLALRKTIIKQGGDLVSRDLLEKIMKEKRLNESDLNYTIDDLRSLLRPLGAAAAVYGHVYTNEDMYIVEVRYLNAEPGNPILFDPIVCSGIDDIFETLPDMASMILSPDKIAPHVVSVEPADGQTNVGQYVEMKIEFSEPMNPATISISGKPENMWQKYGEVVYDSSKNEFIIKVHLYPDIEYEFSLNGELSMGFKDLAGNPARAYKWKFKTGR